MTDSDISMLAMTSVVVKNVFLLVF